MKTFNPLKRFPLLTFVVALALIGAGLWGMGSQSIKTTVVIEAGPRGGFFDTTALMLQDELMVYDIDAKIINREDTLKIIDDVNNPESRVDVGFIAQEMGVQKYPEVTSVATIALEPLFVFHSATLDIKNLHDLKGMRLAVSPPGSGTRAIADLLLGSYGVNAQNSVFLPLTPAETTEAIKSGQVDAAFYLQPPGNAGIKALALDPDLRMLGFPQADALASNIGFLRAVTLHAGGFDYVRGIPEHDLQLVAIPVTLIVKKDLKPAVVTIITQALKKHFQDATLVSRPGEALAITQGSIALNQHAETVLKNGLPYVYRALPFSFAALLDRFSLYVGFILFLTSMYSSMNFPSPKLIWREVQLKWYVGKLQRLLEAVGKGKSLEASDQLLMDKAHALIDTEEARLRKVSRLLTQLRTKVAPEEPLLRQA